VKMQRLNRTFLATIRVVRKAYSASVAVFRTSGLNVKLYASVTCSSKPVQRRGNSHMNLTTVTETTVPAQRMQTASVVPALYWRMSALSPRPSWCGSPTERVWR
jgi:hypothetical protein